MRLSELIGPVPFPDATEDASFSSLPKVPEDEAGQFWAPGKGGFVCERCISNPALFGATSVGPNDTSPCMYCEASGAEIEFAAFETICEYVYRSLLLEYEHPEDSGIYVPHEVRELFGAEPRTTQELLEEIGESISEPQLVEDIDAEINREWVAHDGLYDSYGIQILHSWKSFSREIQTGPRFLFNAKQRSFGTHSLDDVLHYLGVVAAQLQTGFVHNLEPGHNLVRARPWAGETTFDTAGDLGSPPPSMASPQRLSAAGVSCFYAAESQQTAIAELRQPCGTGFSVGRWQTQSPLRFVDLTIERRSPSIFDCVARNLRQFIPFLDGFQRSISKPKDLELGEANSYLPSQVFGEYLRYSLATPWGQGIDAVKYPSTADPSGANWCFFGRPEHGLKPSIVLLSHHQVEPTT